MRLTRSRLGKIALAVLFAIAFFMWAKILTAQESEFGIAAGAFNASAYGGTISKAVSSSAGGSLLFYYGDGVKYGVRAHFSSLKTADVCDTEEPSCGSTGNWGHYGASGVLVIGLGHYDQFRPYLGFTGGYAWLNPSGMETRTTTGPIIGFGLGTIYEISDNVVFMLRAGVESHQFSQISTIYGVIDNAVIYTISVGLGVQ